MPNAGQRSRNLRTGREAVVLISIRNTTTARSIRTVLLASTAGCAMMAAATSASAGGFAVREQSTEFQGMSFAGNAASGGGLSGMFWNPAVVGQFSGLRSETHAAIIFGDSEITTTSASTLYNFPGLDRSINMGETAVVPSGYVSYQLSQQLVLGASFGAPLGLATRPDNQAWVGQTHARDSLVKTYNGQVALAYNLLPSLTLGAGVMLQYIDGELKQAAGTSPSSVDASFRANDFGVGWTAGVTWRPFSGTHLGFGYRSKIDHTLEGAQLLAQTPSVSVGVKADLTTPETATLSLRQALTPQLAVLATAEWAKWSRLQSLDIYCSARGTLFCTGGAGTLSTSLPFGWHDGWFYSGGLEYTVNPSLTLRTGAAYEKSPVQNASERSPRVPDNNRIWGSIGGTAKVNDTVSFDFAYTHIWVDDGQIDRTAAPVRLVADTKANVDIVSGSIKIQLGGAKEPLK